MKVKTTIRIDAELLRKARILAAEKGTSLSGFLAARLEEAVRQRREYEQARRRALARLRSGYDLQWTPLRSRAGLHQR